ncbi:hypothetical protein DPMN_133216 [Dreissena polymorpha]|uniref:Mitochondrial peptide methionine sulfoxide reductase n=1 Tax=Dreissena polymorpha TaxID=45954 RepID=A0A9D4FTX0_DREPO|nr:hypothetical protein DPMN_133216 [Dreissena polymorpha]
MKTFCSDYTSYGSTVAVTGLSSRPDLGPVIPSVPANPHGRDHVASFYNANTTKRSSWKGREIQTAMFGMGCFWGAERKFWKQPGVFSTQVGYSAGYTKNPTYKEVCTGYTGHNEVVRVQFDPNNTSFVELLKVFWENHNPTQLNRQGNDQGTQYRSGIYYYSDEQKEEALATKEEYEKLIQAKGYEKIVTEILPVAEFYYAEDYHQQYLHKNPNGYCGLGGTGVSCPIGLGVGKKKQGKSDL